MSCFITVWWFLFSHSFVFIQCPFEGDQQEQGQSLSCREYSLQDVSLLYCSLERMAMQHTFVKYACLMPRGPRPGVLGPWYWQFSSDTRLGLHPNANNAAFFLAPGGGGGGEQGGRGTHCSSISVQYTINWWCQWGWHCLYKCHLPALRALTLNGSSPNSPPALAASIALSKGELPAVGAPNGGSRLIKDTGNHLG